jgi:hypothetical protein
MTNNDIAMWIFVAFGILCVIVFIFIIYKRYLLRLEFLKCCKENHVDPEDVRKYWNILQIHAMSEGAGIITSEMLQKKVQEVQKEIDFDVVINCGTLGRSSSFFQFWE